MDVNAKLIKQARAQQCWSQQQLAEMAGVSLRTLQRVEKSETASLETVKSLAAVLEIPAAELTCRTAPDEHNEEATKAHSGRNQKQRKRRLMISLVIVCAVNICSLILVFYRFEQQAIDETTFHFLKNLLSITTLGAVIITVLQGFRKGILSKNDFL
ncbi:helix-turn-helix domain-containing protein [Pseudidiomarina sp. CB1]|uniref:helix-turn-helix domain-containing protein n=1 Tax=Pseudidiomarina sp. CB1 TaxID=2972484 RepID=UPI002161CFEB|nr:helix-turn-helix domain-containing protein [Pseudidiomarina sp. CB1]